MPNPKPPEEPTRAYRARANDHLVEPMFAGLGVGVDEEPSAEELADAEASRTGPFSRLLRAVFGRRART